MSIILVGMVYFVYSTYIIYIGLKGFSLRPWISWADPHFDFGQVDLIPLVIWGSGQESIALPSTVQAPHMVVTGNLVSSLWYHLWKLKLRGDANGDVLPQGRNFDRAFLTPTRLKSVSQMMLMSSSDAHGGTPTSPSSSTSMASPCTPDHPHALDLDAEDHIFIADAYFDAPQQKISTLVEGRLTVPHASLPRYFTTFHAEMDLPGCLGTSLVIAMTQLRNLLLKIPCALARWSRMRIPYRSGRESLRVGCSFVGIHLANCFEKYTKWQQKLSDLPRPPERSPYSHAPNAVLARLAPFLGSPGRILRYEKLMDIFNQLRVIDAERRLFEQPPPPEPDVFMSSSDSSSVFTSPHPSVSRLHHLSPAPSQPESRSLGHMLLNHVETQTPSSDSSRLSEQLSNAFLSESPSPGHNSFSKASNLSPVKKDNPDGLLSKRSPKSLWNRFRRGFLHHVLRVVNV
ncbi:hypothetical protein D9757_007804 [Collybiopsis confluens]|uniref:Uncharacterized protein n=1 Tax=Collybiopsis confluens TaxID=2823264 RepID=A0A8H5HQ45_9AGAR|nr:hypothetical protein D9757_007804 [Collybiopsis confluens]